MVARRVAPMGTAMITDERLTRIEQEGAFDAVLRDPPLVIHLIDAIRQERAHAAVLRDRLRKKERELEDFAVHVDAERRRDPAYHQDMDSGVSTVVAIPLGGEAERAMHRRRQRKTRSTPSIQLPPMQLLMDDLSGADASVTEREDTAVRQRDNTRRWLRRTILIARRLRDERDQAREIGRIESALAMLGSEHRPRAGWDAKVLAKAASIRPRYRSEIAFAIVAAITAAAAVIWHFAFAG